MTMTTDYDDNDDDMIYPSCHYSPNWYNLSTGTTTVFPPL